MALYTDAAMVLYYDIEGDNADHDDWHTREHFEERLSIPGFERASRWIATTGVPRYMVIYEVRGTDIAVSPDYLARLNNPTPWTTEMMPRFRGMVRGFTSIIASAGFGYGRAALAIRFTPTEGQEIRLRDKLESEVFPAIMSCRGVTSVQLMQPAPAPPMTKEQSIRGEDKTLDWLLLTTAYEADTLEAIRDEYLSKQFFEEFGNSSPQDIGFYSLHYIATSQEVNRTAINT
ncbi:hypothetical protein [uncultured Sneathiella sp.]|uniref:hypothetical protein n=1 Tax=uncultured Sneathiella sp. TaxID=879315 RepID=UPI0030ECA4DD|tara:strand:+ start:40499 stop:41194 length:696 start_codon:yes stop_codon:yes gene_type:complete